MKNVKDKFCQFVIARSRATKQSRAIKIKRDCFAMLAMTGIMFVVPLILSGCAKNIDLRQQAKENKVQEQKSISSMKSTVDLSEENSQPLENVIAEKAPVKILFVGDMMFDRHIREAVGKYGGGDYNYILEPIKDKLAEYDLVVGNLEGPITDARSVSVNTKLGESKNFVFTFDPAVAKVLAENNIKLVNLGNNHILNQGAKGIKQTKKYLDEAGVEYFGDDKFLIREIGQPASLREALRAGGIRIGFVNYDYSNDNSEKKVIENIKAAKEQSDIVIVCPHWGTEYKVGDPGASIRALAHRFVDAGPPRVDSTPASPASRLGGPNRGERVEAGADAIIGTHPHVVQSSEEYQGKKIYYSLGNFVFDQYFQKETMEGLGVEISIKPDLEMEYNEVKFEMTKRGQTVFRVEP